MNKIEHIGSTDQEYVCRLMLEDGKYYDSSTNNFQTSPTNSEITLVEDSILKGYYSASITITDTVSKRCRIVIYQKSGTDRIAVAGGVLIIDLGRIQSRLGKIRDY